MQASQTFHQQQIQDIIMTSGTTSKSKKINPEFLKFVKHEADFDTQSNEKVDQGFIDSILNSE